MLISELFEGIINDRFVTTAGNVDFYSAVSDKNPMNKAASHASTRAGERDVAWMLNPADPRFKAWYTKAAQVLKAKATPDPVERPYLVKVTSLDQSAIVWYQTRGEIARITTILPPGRHRPADASTVVLEV